MVECDDDMKRRLALVTALMIKEGRKDIYDDVAGIITSGRGFTTTEQDALPTPDVYLTENILHWSPAEVCSAYDETFRTTDSSGKSCELCWHYVRESDSCRAEFDSHLAWKDIREKTARYSRIYRIACTGNIARVLLPGERRDKDVSDLVSDGNV